MRLANEGLPFFWLLLGFKGVVQFVLSAESASSFFPLSMSALDGVGKTNPVLFLRGVLHDIYIVSIKYMHFSKTIQTH